MAKIDRREEDRRRAMSFSRLLRFGAVGTILVGVALAVAGVVSGEIDLVLVIIFPVLIAEGVLGLLSMTLIFLGFLLLFISFFFAPSLHRNEGKQVQETEWRTGEGGKTSVKGGGVILIGPLPLIFGSDWKMAIVAIALAIVLVALVLALSL